MDFFIFLIVSKLLKKKIIYKKILFGAFIAAILYCLFIFIPAINKIYNFFGSLVILMISTTIAFNPHTIKELIKLVIASHIAAFSIGGAGIALFYYTDLPNAIGNMISFNIQNFPFKILLITTTSAYIIIKFSLGWIKNIINRNKVFYPIEIYFNGVKVSLNALVDTGNSLFDPVTAEPVIVAEFISLKDILPDELKLIYYEKRENDISKLVLEIQDSPLHNRIRMIPFSSIGVQSGMLIGFKPDKVEIENSNEKSVIKNVIIAIYNYSLSKDGTYQALINPEIFEYNLQEDYYEKKV
jgi:stage II sporulation protein GA (sporulation sigma-E factor processing peptidase)